jgi:hypothetical protein
MVLQNDGYTYPENGHDQTNLSAGRFAPILENIPEETKLLKRWVNWSAVWDEGKSKFNKPPMQHHGYNGSSTAPAAWTYLDTAYSALGKKATYTDFKGIKHDVALDGVGFVVTKDDNITGVDLDDCIDSGEIHPAALQAVVTLNSYTEISPSGKGLRILVKNDTPLPWSKNTDSEIDIEVYETGRFLTVTGQHLEGTPLTIEQRDEALATFMAKHPRAPKTVRPVREYTGDGERRLELTDFLEKYHVTIFREARDNSSEIAFHILCPWVNEHSGGDESGTRVGQYADGALWFQCDHAHCDSRRWEEFRLYYEPEAYDKKRLKVGAKKLMNNNPDSSDSSDSFSQSFEMPKFPVHAFPQPWADFIEAAARSLACPPELVALPTLGVASGAIGRSRELMIKRRYTVPALLWLVAVADPGAKKSAAQGLALTPLYRIENELKEEYEDEKAAWADEMRQHTLKVKLARRNDEVEPKAPEKPIRRRTLVDDITIEALAKRLEENPRGFLSAQDELSGFLRGMDQYKSGGKGNTRQQYLKIWTLGALRVDRKGDDESLYVGKPFVVLQGGMQPNIIHEIADGRDDGFMDRFLFCYPERMPAGYSEYEIPEYVEDKYDSLIESLWGSGDPETTVIGMTPEAKEMFKEASHALAQERRTPGFPNVLDGTWGKMDFQLARLALILCCARHALEGDKEVVNAGDMSRALELLEYFKAAAKKIWGQIFEADPDESLAARLLTVLTEGGYVYRGTISYLHYKLYGSEPNGGDTERLGKAVRRIIKESPAISLESHSTGAERIITITYRNLSELSELSGDDGGGMET